MRMRGRHTQPFTCSRVGIGASRTRFSPHWQKKLRNSSARRTSSTSRLAKAKNARFSFSTKAIDRDAGGAAWRSAETEQRLLRLQREPKPPIERAGPDDTDGSANHSL